jgi:2-methylcitrate dehydratase
MTEVERLAEFAVRASYDDLSEAARDQLKIRVLDSLGCAIGAMDAAPVRLVRGQVAEFNPSGACTLIGGGQAPPDRATFYNGALVRYLDYNDAYLAKGESCHPSDNVSAVLAATEYASGSGRDLMVALAVAYQVQCRLSDEAPVRAAGFDHTTQGTYAVAAGVSRALGLDAATAANGLAISGTAFNALRVTRTGALSHWKGLAYPNMAAGCVWATFLARRGITGPLEVFEGNKGFIDAIAGHFTIDWASEDLERVTQTVIKRHNAEIHAQTAIDAALELKRQYRFCPADIERIDVEVFDVAYKIIGGGEEGDKSIVCTKEDADHSLPYLIAVSVLDNQVLPPQFAPERIRRDDVQRLLCRVSVRANAEFSQRFPDAMVARVTVTLQDGRSLSREVADYPGLNAPPLAWKHVQQKFESLTNGRLTSDQNRRLVDAVRHLDTIRVTNLMRLLADVGDGDNARSRARSEGEQESRHGGHA